MGDHLAGIHEEARHRGRLMRVSLSGVATSYDEIRVSVDGRPLTAMPGDSVAVAMIDAGLLACREAGEGDLRGVFCGMGACNECLVEVDGVPRLACMTKVADGMRIVRAPAKVRTTTPFQASAEHHLSPDVLVIGGGPAGLSVAAVLAEQAVEVVVVDERSGLGGQYFKQPAGDRVSDEAALDAQFRTGRDLIRRAERSGARILTGTRIWAALDTDHLLAASEDRRWSISPRVVVVASGAIERGVPLPGWTLPGVMTTGAAQTLLRSGQVAPGRRVLISGNGPLNLQVATELAKAGVTVVGLVEQADLRPWRNVSAGLRVATAVPGLVLQGLRYIWTLGRASVPVLDRSSVVRVLGSDRVEGAVVARLDETGHPISGTETTFGLDAVCLGYGFVPSTELTRMLGCTHRFDQASGHLVVERTEAGRTSVDGVWVVGDAGDIGGAPTAIAMGIVAARHILDDLRRAPGEGLNRRAAEASRVLRRHRRFQQGLRRLYRAPVLTTQLAHADTIVCRCETVTLANLTESLGAGTETMGAIKRVTRAGMGRCQGRYCGAALAELAAGAHGHPQGEMSGFAPQPPLRPTEVAVMAQPGEHGRHMS
jgi:thioredoxin reductase